MKSALLLVIFLEGYIILSSELIAIRILVPFVGNGTETVSIIIAAVLMPLAFGYYFGGKYTKKTFRITVREKLIQNILNSSVLLALGLSYVFLLYFFEILHLINIQNRIILTLVYACLFLVYPVFLLGQTVPLVSNYFRKQDLSQTTGLILFFSTVGSFLGATLSTLFIMSFLGVNYAAILTLTMALFIALTLSRKLISTNLIIILPILALTLWLNSPEMLTSHGIISNNQFNVVGIKTPDGEPDSRILMVNHSASSKIAEDKSQMFNYWKFLEDQVGQFIRERKDLRILVIGAGGFTFGIDDPGNHYTFVDVDPSLKDVSEKYFLKRPLGENVTFISEPAESFILSHKDTYDVIFLDAFTNVHTTPFQLITAEFFLRIKERLNPNGVVISNIIASGTYNDAYSLKYDNSFRVAFPSANRTVLTPRDPWDTEALNSNIIYIYYHRPENTSLYSDIKNSYFIDR